MVQHTGIEKFALSSVFGNSWERYLSRNIKTGDNLDFLEATHGYSVSDIVCGILKPDGLRDGDAVVVDGGAGLPPPLHQGGAQDEGPAEDRKQERGRKPPNKQGAIFSLLVC